MNESLDAQGSQGKTPEQRKPTRTREASPLSVPERKSPETEKRETLQRQVHAVVIEAKQKLKGRAGELGRDRTERQQALREVLQGKTVEVEGKELKLSEAIAQLTKAIAADESSPEHSLVKGLKVTAVDIEENSEYGWVLGKIVSLNAITEKTKPFFVLALEAAHRGGPAAEPLKKAIVAKLISLIRRSKRAREEMSEKAAEILQLIKQAEAGEVSWKIVIEKYGLPEQGDLRREDVERFAQTDVTEKSIKKVLRVEEEGVETEEKVDRVTIANIIRVLRNKVLESSGEERIKSIEKLRYLLSTAQEKGIDFTAKQLRRLVGNKAMFLVTEGAWGGLAAAQGLPIEEYERQIRAVRGFDPTLGAHAGLLTVINQINAYGGIAELPLEGITKQIERLTNLSGETAGIPELQGLAFDLWLELANQERVVEEERRRGEEEQRQKRTGRMFPHLALIQERRPKLTFDPIDVSAVESADLRGYLQDRMASIKATIEDCLDNRMTPPPPPELRMHQRQLESVINRYLEDRDIPLAERERVERIRESLIEQLRGIEGQAEGILKQIPIRERWMALGLEPEDLEALDDPETAEQWFRDRVILIEQKEEQESSRGVLGGEPLQKLNWGLAYLYSHKGIVWQAQENKELREYLERMVHLRLRLHDHFHGYAREKFEEIQMTISELGIGGVVLAESLHNAKTMVAKDTLARMFERHRFVKVKLTDEDTEFTGFGEEGKEYIAALRMTPPEQRKVMQATVAYLEKHMQEYGFRDEAEIKELVRVARNIWVAEQRYARHRSRDRIDRPSEVVKKQGESTYVSELGRFHLELLNFHDFVVERWTILTTPFAARYRRQLRSLGRQAVMFYEQYRGGQGKLTDKDYLEIGKDVSRNLTLMYTYWDSGWRIGKLCDSIKARYKEAANALAEDDPNRASAETLLEEYQEELAVGARLKKAADDYSDEVEKFLVLKAAKGKKYLEKPHVEQNKGIPFDRLYNEAHKKVMEEAGDTERAKFLKLVERGMKARPLEFAKILANEQDFNQFLKTEFGNKLSGRLNGINGYIELEEKLGDLLYPIYTKVVRPIGSDELDAPFAKAGKRSLFINSRDLTPAEKEWVIQQLPEDVKPDEFFAVADRLHDYLTSPEKVREIADNPKYRYFFRETRWIDDVPFHELHKTSVHWRMVEKDDPSKEVAQVNKDNIITFTEESVSGGFRDPLVRVYGDMQAGEEAKKSMAELLQTNDPERMAELTAEIIKNAKEYAPPWKTIQMGPIVLETFKDLKAEWFWNITGLAGKINVPTSRAQREFQTADPALSLTSQKLFEIFRKTQQQYGSWTIIAPWFYEFATKELGFHFVSRNIDTIRAVSILLLVGWLSQLGELFDED